jgi:hypothetical protein
VSAVAQAIRFVAGLGSLGYSRRYGPHKTIYNRFIRWNRMGVFMSIVRTSR